MIKSGWRLSTTKSNRDSSLFVLKLLTGNYALCRKLIMSIARLTLSEFLKISLLNISFKSKLFVPPAQSSGNLSNRNCFRLAVSNFLSHSPIHHNNHNKRIARDRVFSLNTVCAVQVIICLVSLSNQLALAQFFDR